VNRLDKNDNIVSGYHAQADNFRTLFEWLLKGGAKFPKLYLARISCHSRDGALRDGRGRLLQSTQLHHEIGQTIIHSKVELRSKLSYLASYLLQREKERERLEHLYFDFTVQVRDDSAELAGSVADQEDRQSAGESAARVRGDLRRGASVCALHVARFHLGSRFFVNYCFSLEENGDNEALLTFELPSNDTQYAIKARHLGFNVAIEQRNFRFRCSTRRRRSRRRSRYCACITCFVSVYRQIP